MSSLVANATVQNFTAAAGTLNYNNDLEKPLERSYDACYYEISSVP